MIVGVTGSLAALGDTLFPASSLGLALAQDFSATSGWLVRWRWMHPTVAFLASIVLIWLLVLAARRTTGWDNRSLSALILLLAGRGLCAGFAGRCAAGTIVGAGSTPPGCRYAVGRTGGVDGELTLQPKGTS